MTNQSAITPDILSGIPSTDATSPRIYAYRLDLAEKKGLIKVGETSRSSEERIREQLKTAGLLDRSEILLDEPAVRDDGRTFRDKDVHAVLKEMSGVSHHPDGGGVEWFDCTIEQVRSAVNSVRTGVKYEKVRYNAFALRPEQANAVETADLYLNAALADGREPRMLWNAKMRFGKTFAAYHLAKKRQARRILVVTYKPAVQDAWKDDLETHIDFEGWRFVARTSDYDPRDVPSATPLVCFSSLQDLRGQGEDGDIKEHNRWIHELQWDLVIVDEYHYGAWNDSTRQLLSGEAGGGQAELAKALGEDAAEDASGDLVERLGNIKGKCFLCLSGTPFRAIASNEFEKEQIFNWTYTDEQRAKAEFATNFPDRWSPYRSLPQMHLLVYELPERLREVAKSGSRDEFSLATFFAATGAGTEAKFAYLDQVQGWLEWLRGNDKDAVLQALGSSLTRPFPYSDTNFLPCMNHTVWFLPSVAAVYAMRNLLRAPQNASFWASQFAVLPVAGSQAGIGPDALPPVLKEIRDGRKTITLTCGKLLTGVTVPQWSAILMLNSLESPESYFQAAFRVQSPWSLKNPDGKNPNDEQVVKPVCLVIDFAPSRALRLFVDYGMRLGEGRDADKEVADLLKFLPVLGFDGTKMREVGVDEIIDRAFESTSVDTRQMQSKRFIAPRASKLELVSDATRLALMRVTKQRQSGSAVGEAGTVINNTPELKDTGKAADGSGQEQAESEEAVDLTEVELADRLTFLAKRINAFMYLSDAVETNLSDVLSTDEPDLFRLVMELQNHDMAELVKAGLFNEPAMRLAIHQFRRADVDSFSYTGLDPRSGSLSSKESKDA